MYQSILIGSSSSATNVAELDDLLRPDSASATFGPLVASGAWLAGPVGATSATTSGGAASLGGSAMSSAASADSEFCVSSSTAIPYEQRAVVIVLLAKLPQGRQQ